MRTSTIEAMARALMWAHLVYLMALPLAGVFCLSELTRHTGTANLGGWIAAAVFLAFQAKYYRFPARPLAALLTTTIVPVQVLAHVLVFGGDFAEYFVEEAFVELACLSWALALVMLAYRPSGWGGAAIGVGIAAIAFVGFGWPVIESYLEHGAGPELWALLIVVLVSGTWAHVRLTGDQARGELGEPGQHDGWLARAIDRVSRSDGAVLEPGLSDGVVAVLIVVQSVLWLIVPSVGKAVL